jgi:hypothetical protein
MRIDKFVLKWKTYLLFKGLQGAKCAWCKDQRPRLLGLQIGETVRGIEADQLKPFVVRASRITWRILNQNIVISLIFGWFILSVTVVHKFLDFINATFEFFKGASSISSRTCPITLDFFISDFKACLNAFVKSLKSLFNNLIQGKAFKCGIFSKLQDILLLKHYWVNWEARFFYFNLAIVTGFDETDPVVD